MRIENTSTHRTFTLRFVWLAIVLISAGVGTVASCPVAASAGAIQLIVRLQVVSWFLSTFLILGAMIGILIAFFHVNAIRHYPHRFRKDVQIVVIYGLIAVGLILFMSPLLALMVASVAALIASLILSGNNLEGSQCRECGYDISGHWHEVCPECGTNLNPQVHQQRSSWPRTVLCNHYSFGFLVLLVLTVAVIGRWGQSQDVYAASDIAIGTSQLEVWETCGPPDRLLISTPLTLGSTNTVWTYQAGWFIFTDVIVDVTFANGSVVSVDVDWW